MAGLMVGFFSRCAYNTLLETELTLDIEKEKRNRVHPPGKRKLWGRGSTR